MKRSTPSTSTASQTIQNKQTKTDAAVEIVCLEDVYLETWNQLNSICCKLASLDSPQEVNDIMFVLTQDPKKLEFLDIDYDDEIYGAIEQAEKLLYSNGICDAELSRFLWSQRNQLIKNANLSCLTNRTAVIDDWTAINTIGDGLFSDFYFHVPKPKFGKNATRLEFEILLSTDPSIFQDEVTKLEIGSAKIEMAAAVCTHILDGVKAQENSDFRVVRNKKILKFWNEHLKTKVPNPITTFRIVKDIVRKCWIEDTEHDQIDALTILMIIDARLLRSRYLLSNSHPSEELLNEIEGRLKLAIEPRANADPKMTQWKNGDASKLIVANVKNGGKIKKFTSKIKKFLRRKIRSRPDLIFIGEYFNGKLVCGNSLTFEWLKVAVEEFSPLTVIDKWTQMADDDFKNIVLLSPTRLTSHSFEEYMDLFRAAHPDLRTNLWRKTSSTSDWKWKIKADIKSIVYLENYQRRIEVGNLLFKFDVRYL